MNKFNQKFQDSKLETDYSIQTQSLKHQLLVVLDIIVVCTGIPQFYLAYQTQDQTRFIVQLINCAYALLTIALSYYHREQSENFLIILNHTIALVQLTSNVQSQNFMYGSCMMMAHTVIIIVCDFDKAALQMISLSFMKAFIWVHMYHEPEYSVFVALISLLMLEIYCLFKVNQYKRELYLLTLKDNQYVQILQNIISESFVLFHYNPITLSFALDISTCHVKSQQNLTDFLRASTISNQTLENYIFYRKQNNFHNQEKVIQYHKKLLKISHSQFTSTQLSILIVFKEQLKIESIGKQFRNISLKLQHFLHFQNEQLRMALEKKKVALIYQQRMLNHLVVLQLQMNFREPKITKIQLYQTIKAISSLLFKKQIIIQVDVKLETINSIKEYINILMIHYLRSFQSKMIRVYCDQNEDQEIVIEFHGMGYKEMHQLNSRVEMILIKSTNFSMQQNVIILKITLYSDPQINFRL